MSPKPTETSVLLEQIGGFIRRFVVLPEDSAAMAISLFVLHTYAIEAAHATPYLAVVSAEKQSGKTRLLEVLELLVRKPWRTSSTTEAALFRKIERDEPCLLLDEIDAIFGSNVERTEPLRAVLNAGNRRGASATRVVGQGTTMEVRDFAVFCPKVLAGIDTGRLPETIRDRALIVNMKRRHDEERVDRLRVRLVQDEVDRLRLALEAWAEQHVEGLRNAVPNLPEELSDRAGDAWESLLAIADRAGGDWPHRAREAAVSLSMGANVAETSRGTLLLAAIWGAMIGREAIATEELLHTINTDDELPFGGWREGKGLDPRTLARLLKPYGVRPTSVRVGDKTPKGYRADDLRDAWSRYLPSQGPQHAQQAQRDRAETGGVADVADVADLTGVDAGDGQLDLVQLAIDGENAPQLDPSLLGVAA